MPSGAKLFLFILFLPFLAALGHDLYLNYYADEEKREQLQALNIDPEEFMISDAGWVWQEYSEPTMDSAREAIAPETWKHNIDPILQLPTIVVAIIPFFFGAVFLLITFILGIWPFTRHGTSRKKSDKDFVVYIHI